MALLGRVCGLCNAYIRGDAPCTSPACAPSRNRSPLAKDIQIGMIDGEQVGYFPRGAGPYVEPGKSLKRRVRNKHAWGEFLKRSEGRIGDAS